MHNISDNDLMYMRRAIRLALCGDTRTATNPRVGAVIVARDRIIGEGYHRRFGGPHAEVNAVRSVTPSDIPLLKEATIYVTLEPCSHYGKTPPCANLLIECGMPRIVIGAEDPFPKVAGRGIKMLRDAGCEVICGVLEKECSEINAGFMTAHRLGRPYIQLKWAESADGFIAAGKGEPRAIFSNPLSSVLMHAERAKAGAIVVGVDTVIADNPRLKRTLWPGKDPIPVSRASDRLPAESIFMQNEHLLRGRSESLPDFLHRLYAEHKIISIMVEGGATVLQEFIDAGLFDEARIEVSQILIHDGVKAPAIDLRTLILTDIFSIDENKVMIFHR